MIYLFSDIEKINIFRIFLLPLHSLAAIIIYKILYHVAKINQQYTNPLVLFNKLLIFSWINQHMINVRKYQNRIQQYLYLIKPKIDCRIGI